MRPLVGPVPEPAERAASALRRCPQAILTLGSAGGSHAGDGTNEEAGRADAAGTVAEVSLIHQAPGTADLWIAVPSADAAHVLFGGLDARLEVLDVVVGGAAQGRCRRVVVVEGRVEHPGIRIQRLTAADIARDLPDHTLLDVGTSIALLRLRSARVVLTDHDGVTGIEPEDLATSGPDPFSDLEGHWLDHLNDPRCQIVPRMALRVCRCLPAERPLLVGIDRSGVDIELSGRDGGIRRERLPFAEVCSAVTELGTQIRLLATDSRYALDRAALRP